VSFVSTGPHVADRIADICGFIGRCSEQKEIRVGMAQGDHADELHRTSRTEPHATDQTVVASNQPSAMRWRSHSQRSEGSFISGRKEADEFRNNLVRQGTLHSA
jgi:hypothetical protein